MKKTKGLLLLLCLVLCFGIAYSANAETPLSAKQQLLSKIQSSDFGLQNELYENSSGTASYEIKALSGMLISGFEPLKTLAGTELKLDYKLNSPEKKLGSNYDLVLNKNTYKGDLFIDDNKLILSSEVLSLIKTFDPNFSIGGKKDLPQYVYFTDREIAKMWENIIKSKGQSLPPGSKELLVFIFEAVPDKYFTTSLVNQKVGLSINQNGFEDVVLSVLQKVKNEKERFATLVANFVVAFDSTQDPEKIKKEVLRDLEKSISNGSFPDSQEKIQKLLAGMVVLEELTYEASLLPSGPSRFFMAVNFGDDSKLAGRITLDTNLTGSKDNLSGTYVVSLTAKENVQKIKVDGQINGQFKQTGVDMKSDGLVKVNVKDFSGASTLLDFALQASSAARVDKDVRINIPVLTESNSMNIEKYMKNIPEVLVDGKPVVFDVDPVTIKIKDGKRIMVPLRNLAEALGSEVTWVEPDQININRGDTSMTMYINKRSYMVNGIEKQLDMPPFIKSGKRTMVPVRIVAEELGCRVEYDEISNTVFISSN